MLQPMYVAKSSAAEPQLIRTLDAAAVAPPVSAFK